MLGVILLYKFDPMDFETIITLMKIEKKLLYKFDPMDFETPNNRVWTKQANSINLILWILKRASGLDIEIKQWCINLILWILKQV